MNSVQRVMLERNRAEAERDRLRAALEPIELWLSEGRTDDLLRRIADSGSETALYAQFALIARAALRGEEAGQ